MCLTTVNEFSKQIMPMFIPQRAVYEVRERPSRVYRWTSELRHNTRKRKEKPQNHDG